MYWYCILSVLLTVVPVFYIAIVIIIIKIMIYPSRCHPSTELLIILNDCPKMCETQSPRKKRNFKFAAMFLSAINIYCYEFSNSSWMMRTFWEVPRSAEETLKDQHDGITSTFAEEDLHICRDWRTSARKEQRNDHTMIGAKSVRCKQWWEIIGRNKKLITCQCIISCRDPLAVRLFSCWSLFFQVIDMWSQISASGPLYRTWNCLIKRYVHWTIKVSPRRTSSQLKPALRVSETAFRTGRQCTDRKFCVSTWQLHILRHKIYDLFIVGLFEKQFSMVSNEVIDWRNKN